MSALDDFITEASLRKTPFSSQELDKWIGNRTVDTVDSADSMDTSSFSPVRSLKRGYANTAESIGGGLKLAGGLIDSPNLVQTGEDTRKYWQDVAQNNPSPDYMQEGFFKGMQTNPTGTLATLATESVPNLVTMFAPAGVLGKAGQAGALAGSMLGSFGLEAGSAYNEAIDNGATPDQAELAGGLTGLSNAMLEVLPAGMFINRIFGKAKSTGFLRGVLGMGLAEGGTESAQEMVNQAWSKIYNPDREMFNKDLFERYVEAGVAGGLMGVGMGAVSHKSADLEEKPKDKKIEVKAEDIQQITPEIQQTMATAGQGLLGELSQTPTQPMDARPLQMAGGAITEPLGNMPPAYEPSLQMDTSQPTPIEGIPFKPDIANLEQPVVEPTVNETVSGTVKTKEGESLYGYDTAILEPILNEAQSSPTFGGYKSTSVISAVKKVLKGQQITGKQKEMLDGFIQTPEIAFQQKTNDFHEAEKIVTDNIKQLFPTAKIKETDIGWHLTLPNKSTLTITPDQVIITPQGKSAYGSMTLGKESLMQLDPEANLGTVSHETYHFARRSVMTEAEIARDDAKYGSEEGSAEAFRQANPRQFKNKTFQKIYDFLLKLKDMFIESTAKTQRLIQSGGIFSREAKISRKEAVYQEHVDTSEANAEAEGIKQSEEEYFQGHDDQEKQMKVKVASIQTKIQELIGFKPSLLLSPLKRAEHIVKSKHLDEVIQVYIDLKPTQENPNRPNEVYAKYKDKLTVEQRSIVEEAFQLEKNPKLKAIADEILVLDKLAGEEALKLGIITNMRENHLSRKWEPQHGKGGRKGFFTKTGLAKQRVFDSILEGWSLGRTLVTKGATSALLHSTKSLNDVKHNREFIDKLKGQKGKDGNPLLSQKMYEGYEAIRNPSFAEYGGNYAPKELADKLNAIWGESQLKGIPAIDMITKSNAIMKSWILQSSFFHHMAYIRSYLFTTPMTSLKDLNPKKAYEDGLKAVKNYTPDVQLLVKNGLTFGEIGDWDESLLQESTAIGRRIDKMGGIAKKTKDILKSIRDEHANFLFNELGTGLKVQTALMELAHEKKINGDRKVPLSNDEMAHNVAYKANKDYGGQHLKRMGRNPSTQHIIRLFLLAPDWTESNIRTIAHAIGGTKTGITQEQADGFRALWANVATRTATAYILMNIVMASLDDEDFIERLKNTAKDNKWKDMGINITPLAKALGADPDRRYYWSLLGHFGDPIKWGTSPIQSIHNKQSVVAKMVYEAFSGTNWQGRSFTTLPELMGIDKQGEFYQSNRGGRTTGESKSGRHTGQITKWGSSPHAIDFAQIPSYFASQVKGTQPTQVQNLVSFALGEMEGFSALFKSMGLRVSSRKVESPDTKFDKEFRAVKNIWARSQYLTGNDKASYLSAHRDSLVQYRKMKLVDKQVSKLNRRINKIKKSKSRDKENMIIKLEALKLRLKGESYGRYNKQS